MSILQRTAWNHMSKQRKKRLRKRYQGAGGSQFLVALTEPSNDVERFAEFTPFLVRWPAASKRFS